MNLSFEINQGWSWNNTLNCTVILYIKSSLNKRDHKSTNGSVLNHDTNESGFDRIFQNQNEKEGRERTGRGIGKRENRGTYVATARIRFLLNTFAIELHNWVNGCSVRWKLNTYQSSYPGYSTVGLSRKARRSKAWPMTWGLLSKNSPYLPGFLVFGPPSGQLHMLSQA